MLSLIFPPGAWNCASNVVLLAGDLFLWALAVVKGTLGDPRSSCAQREHRAIRSYKQTQRNHFIRKGHFDSSILNGLQNPPRVLSLHTRAKDGVYPQGSKLFRNRKKSVNHVSPRNRDP